MGGDLQPEDVLKSLKRGQLAPFYLFYGQGEFRLEKVLDEIREVFLPDSARDFNLEIFYGGKDTDPADIINHALSIPFMAQKRLIIVRRTENFSANQLDKFVPYLERPAESTCLIFVSSKTNFNMKFYKRIRTAERAVDFKKLKDNQIVPWIKRAAKELGLNIDDQACAYLQHMAGSRLRNLYAELEKLYLRYGETSVGVAQVEELAIHSRIYTIFELMNKISEKNCVGSLTVLSRFLEEEDKKSAPLRVIGMLNRQIRLLWQTKSILGKGGGKRDVAKMLGPARFSVDDFMKQSKYWSVKDFKKGLYLLYQADGLLKMNSRPKPVLENLILSLCH